MKQFVIIGMDTFGSAMAEELSKLDLELIIIDRDPSIIQQWKDRVDAAYSTDTLDLATLEQIVPAAASGIVVDLMDASEDSILVTHYLTKLGHKRIMVRAKSREHGEVIALLGAMKVIHPGREAAQRLVPSLVNHGLISYTPMGRNLAFSEIPVPENLVGSTVKDAQFRAHYSLNIVAVRTLDDASASPLEDSSETADWQSITADYIFKADTVLLVSGDNAAIQAYAHRFDQDSNKGWAHKLLSRLGRKKAR